MSKLKIASNNNTLIPGSIWVLKDNINGYKHILNDELSTQASAGRRFEIVHNPSLEIDSYDLNRIQVRLLEDGYICWLDLKDLLFKIENSVTSWNPIFFTCDQIKNKIPSVLSWIADKSKKF